MQGGGFGGKETRSVFLTCALAVAARKHGIPVRCMLTREEDMAVSGTRHPFWVNYTVGFDDFGKIHFLEADLFSNAGYSMDLSLAVMERAMTHIDNCYNIPNVRLNGTLCKTNLPTNTAFRGFHLYTACADSFRIRWATGHDGSRVLYSAHF